MRILIAGRSSQRRLILVVSVFLPSLFTACRGTLPPTTSGSQVRIRQAAEALNALRLEEPALPGFSRADSITVNAFGNRSRADADLLLARLFHDVSTVIESRAIDKPSLRAKLAAPRPAAPLTRSYFDDLLRDTNRRMATDGQFGRAIASAASLSRQRYGGSPCVVGGMSMPINYCSGSATWWTLWYEQLYS